MLRTTLATLGLFALALPGQYVQHRFPTQGPQPGTLKLVRSFPKLTFARPIFLVAPPDQSDRIFVVEQGGKVLVFPNDDNVATTKLFLDVSAKVSRVGNEEGLLGLAFDPAYKSNGYFYIHYVTPTPRYMVVSRFTVSASNPDAADPASEKILLRESDPYSNHNGGWIDFGPDNKLYVTFGDGGSGGDPLLNGQNMNTVLAKILRIDPHTTTGALPYGIPRDNPFVGRPNTREEIWCLGMRNPWRCSFDRSTGELWCGDVGQGAREEVDLIRKGGNFAWNVYEGNAVYRNPNNLPPSQFDMPVIDYDTTQGRCVIGGYVYRGSKWPQLRGLYFYGDYTSGRIWAMLAPGGKFVSSTLVGTLASICSFGEDQGGELFLVSLSGGIWRLEPNTVTTPPFPERLSETGLFEDTATLREAPGLLAYELNHALWSDHAEKRRWLGMPAGGKIGFAATAAWTLPKGSVLVKHFEMQMRLGDPASTKRLETRVLVHEAHGWAGYTYRWNSQQTDALLIDGRESESLVVRDQNNTVVRTQNWSYPSRTDCLQCHTEAEGRVLGPRTRQLNRDVALGQWRGNQLELWNQMGLFDRDIGSSQQYEQYAAVDDSKRPLRERARAYLAVNCALCHQKNGTAPTGIDLRYDVPDAQMNAFDVRPTAGDLGLIDAHVIKTDVRESSVLWERMRRLDQHRMPVLGSNVVDPQGVALLGAWIGTPFTSFGVSCGGTLGAAPAAQPRLGANFQIEARGLQASAPTALMLGASNTNWGSFQLPLDLTFLGMNGCFLLVSAEASDGTQANNGVATFSLAVPNNPGLLQQRFYVQAFAQDATANLLGVTATNGGAVIVVR